MPESHEVLDIVPRDSRPAEPEPPPGFETKRARALKRLPTFLGIFGCLSLLVLAYCFMRPPVYQARAALILRSARAEPALEAQGAASTESSGVGGSELVVARQVLLNRSLLEQTARRLNETTRPGEKEKPSWTADAVAERVRVELVPEGNLIRLYAEGRDREALTSVLNAWIQVYREMLEKSRQSSLRESSSELEEEIAALERKIREKREELARFREENDIVSLEREENQLVSRIRGLNDALARAREQQVGAEARLRAMEEARARGEDILEGRELRLVTSLEEKAEALRDRLRDYRQRYTEKYMAIDPEIRSVRAQLQRIEEKIAVTRREAEDAALDKARQDLETARKTVVRLQDQLRELQDRVRVFNDRFARHQALVDELKDLEALYRRRKEQRVRQDVAPTRNLPKLSVLEPPSAPERPVRPDYVRDAAVGLAGALVVSLLGLWLVEFLLRTPDEGQPSAGPTLIFQPNVSRPTPMEDRSPTAALPERSQGEQPLKAFRELSTLEVEAMLRAATPMDRVVICLLLSGVRREELDRICWKDVDFESNILRIPGDAERKVVLAPACRKALESLWNLRRGTSEDEDISPRSGDLAERPLLADEAGEVPSSEAVSQRLLYVAQEAGLAAPSEVTPEALRHTYILFLVRQGIRLSSLSSVVGPLSSEELSRYSVFAPPGLGRDLSDVVTVFPPLARSLSGK